MGFAINENIMFNTNRYGERKRARKGSYKYLPEFKIRYRLFQDKIFVGYDRAGSIATIGIKDFKKIAEGGEEERKKYLEENYKSNTRYLIRKLFNFYDMGLINMPTLKQIYDLHRFGSLPNFEFVKTSNT